MLPAQVHPVHRVHIWAPAYSPPIRPTFPTIHMNTESGNWLPPLSCQTRDMPPFGFAPASAGLMLFLAVIATGGM